MEFKCTNFNQIPDKSYLSEGLGKVKKKGRSPFFILFRICKLFSRKNSARETVVLMENEIC